MHEQEMRHWWYRGRRRLIRSSCGGTRLPAPARGSSILAAGPEGTPPLIRLWARWWASSPTGTRSPWPMPAGVRSTARAVEPSCPLERKLRCRGGDRCAGAHRRRCGGRFRSPSGLAARRRVRPQRAGASLALLPSRRGAAAPSPIYQGHAGAGPPRLGPRGPLAVVLECHPVSCDLRRPIRGEAPAQLGGTLGHRRHSRAGQ